MLFACAAYEFAKKFPGYTSDNLAEKGIHEVNARRFVLVAADHPRTSNKDQTHIVFLHGLFLLLTCKCIRVRSGFCYLGKVQQLHRLRTKQPRVLLHTLTPSFRVL